MKSYITTDQHIHGLSQIIAKVNNSFVPKRPDDSHTNLYFDWLGDSIVGRWIETGEGRILLSLKLSELRFEWLNSAYQIMASFPTSGKMIADVENDIENHLPELGLAKDRFTNKLHFEIPDYPFKVDPIQPIPNQRMEAWKHIRNLANDVCTILLGHLQVEGEVRIWPHHFDTGIYVTTETGLGIGFGLAMSDGMVDGPYFYTSGHLTSAALAYHNLPELTNGNWVTSEHWNGAVLPLSALKDLPMAAYKAKILDHLLKTVNWFLKQC